MDLFKPELLPSETILWTGQPSPRVFFHKTDWGMIPFSLLWGGFAIFWEFGATNATTRNGGVSFFTLWGVPFVLIGQYMIWGRFLYVAWRKRRTFYAVTDRRVLVLSQITGRKVVDSFLGSVEAVTLDLRPDGIGTIEFAPEPSRQNWFGGNRTRFDRQMSDIDLSRLCFYDIQEAREVHRLIQTQRQSLQAIA